ncbi:MAG TPA: sugar phosphate isomerase/epimerase family protein [bacterium]|nr:sugar phosphate isomerase/epimerase family protein [bacterium]
MILGACVWVYGDVPLADALARIADAGCDGVELPGEPDRMRASEVRRLLARHRLTPVALTASCKVPETRRDLGHPDPAVRSAAVAYVVECLRFAADAGVPLVQMLPSGESRLAPIADRADEWRWSVEAMRLAAREAERLGVRVAVEPLNRYEAYLVTTVDEGLAYLDAVASPWVGLTLDLFHANIEERTIPGAIGTAGARLFHVHVADTTREGLGRGHLDLETCIAGLHTIGYEGALVLEVVPRGLPFTQSSEDRRGAATLDRDLRDSVTRLRTALSQKPRDDGCVGRSV